MKILSYPMFEIIENPVVQNRHDIVAAARDCYQSVSKGPGYDSRLLAQCAKNDHSVLEFSTLHVKFHCDRGVSHELVRHRLASYAQESTRYCNYSNDKFGHEITVVQPVNLAAGTEAYKIWETSCKQAEKSYFELLDAGVAPETARSVLPNSLKTTINMRTNLREWRHVLALRDSRKAQPDIRYMMHAVLLRIVDDYPEIFDDLFWNANKEIVEDFSNKRKA